MIILKNGRNTGTLEHFFHSIAVAMNLRMSLRYLRQAYIQDTKDMPSSSRGHYDHQHIKKVAEALTKPELASLLNVEEIHALMDIRIAATIKTVAEATQGLKEQFGLEFEDGDIDNQYEQKDA